MSDITLYELVREGKEGPGFSPFVWKTKVDLAYPLAKIKENEVEENPLAQAHARILGVKVDSEKRDFHLIRTQLAEETGNDKVTVPTLKVGDEYITDSWVIAEWLEKHHAKDGKTLFPGGEAAAGLVKFLNSWVDNQLANDIRTMLGPKVLATLKGPAREHFVNNKLGGAHKVDRFLSTADDPDHIAKQTTAARTKLGLIEKLLADQQAKGNDLWLTGKSPSHADAVLFGWYAFSKVNPVVVKAVWEHQDLPLTQQWIKGVEGLVESSDLAKASL